MGNFIVQDTVNQFHIPIHPLLQPHKLQAIDGAPIRGEIISHCTEPLFLQISALHKDTIILYITISARNPVILGLQWLELYNPPISWTDKKIPHWSPYCHGHCLQAPVIPLATTIVESPNNLTPVHVLPEHHELYEVFSKEKASRLPPHLPYDCAIELLPGSSPPRGFSLRPCIHYWSLNQCSVKYHYPLPLLPAALEQLRSATIFTKLGLHSAYNLFYVVNTPMTWTDAQKYCRAKYTDLATIANDEEMNAVKEALNGSTEHFWIGLRQTDSNSSIVFNSRSWVWSDNSQVSYGYWNETEPNNDGIDNCVEIWEASANNKWNDAGCNNTVHFVCYKRRTPLTVITEKKTWREALRYCRQHHVDLVSVDSQEMQDWVEVVTKNVSSDMWIGLRHTCALGFWYWVKGEMICYQDWAPGNGTGVEDCSDVERTGAVLSESKKWVSLPQTHELYFICITFQ
ncbi:macrophage mannose receptor 1-like [Ictalurus furcatus]|uniref:macrophage mannose receptor 1-like n=1 Tax=Ictalurus furcatus TaxID=66913 RepID=UPI0023509D4F|nr:macrophage mannose receptor 1-like [Ictalurus furcatus]